MVNFAGMEFIFYFFPVFLLIYHLIPIKYKDVVLLLGSYLFYASGDPKYVLLLLLLTLCNYFMGQQIHKLSEGYKMHSWQRTERKKKLAFIISLDVTVLLVFVDSSLFPLGLSFYLFKMISFQVDYYRGEIFEKTSFLSVAVYFSLFPQVISGPIMRYNEGTEPQNRIYCLSQLEDGMKYFAAGLGMKVLLADRLAILWNDLQMIGYQSISTPLAWLGAAGYSLQLYFDFWGYSLMASGILVCLGFDFIENFHHPYASGSIGEFYRRWHMTLGRFFRDYVYIPLGGSRCRKNRLILNLMIVWLITGLWHGNGLNYLLWGAVLGLFIMLEKLFYGEGLKKLPVLRNLYVLFLIPLTWVIFAITDLHQLLIYFGRLFPVFGGTGVAVNTGDFLKYAGTYGKLFLAGGLLCIPGVFDFLEKHRKNPLVIAGLLLIFWYSVYFMASSGENPFLYFQF
ncbi:MBOAT family O-acyltransferase [Suilimivivens sp.]|uniref:MBOAT family O-acyltransferase n=1 Tax=Suilimivivens sp. TaxID=2981669 RepID=UPI0030780F11